MATASSTIAVNGKKVTIESDLNDGSYTVSYKGQTIGTGSNSSGGKINFKEGSVSAQKELLNLSGSRSRFLQRSLRNSVQNQVEKENISLLNNNASTAQKLNLRDMGYGNNLDIEGVTTARNDENNSGSPITGNGTASQGETRVFQSGKSGLSGNTEKRDVRYPLKYIESSYDFVKFSIKEYIPGGKENFSRITSGEDARVSTRMTGTKPIGTIILPMPLNLPGDNTAVGWGDSKLNALQGAGADIINAALPTEKGEEGQMGKTLNNALEGLGAQGAEFKNLVKAKAAEMIVGGGNILTRTTGAVMNSNLELLFDGPSLRSFNFSYKLTPRGDDEASEIRSMIRMIKRAMAAKLKTASLFLHTPDVFQIEFKFNGGEDHPFLNRIKPCALQSFNVNYTPDGAYMTYKDGSPVAYNISLGFKEMEPVYDIDYDKGEGKKGTGF